MPGNLQLAANDTYMHHDSFTKMQDAIDQCVQESTVDKLPFCDAYGLIVDESTDISITYLKEVFSANGLACMMLWKQCLSLGLHCRQL